MPIETGKPPVTNASTPDDLVRQLRTLPPVPKVLIRLQPMLADMNTSIDDIAAMIRLERALAARILQVSNSAFIGLGDKARSIEEAIALIGFREVRRLVSLVLGMQIMEKPLPAYGIEARSLWLQSIACGLTAEELSDPKSKTSEVVKYLELRMPEDNVVVGREVPKDGWAPAESEITLTPSSWIGAKSLAEKIGKVEVQDTRELELALKSYAASGPGLQQGSPRPDLEKARDLLRQAQQALGTYRPRRQGGKGEVGEMKGVVGSFKQKVGARVVELERLISQA